MWHTSYVATAIASTSPHGTFAVRTQYGLGTVLREREDGVLVVRLEYGLAYMQPSAILTSIANHGRYAAKTPHQLHRLGQLCTMLFTQGRDLTREEQAYCDEQVLLRCVTLIGPCVAWRCVCEVVLWMT